MSREEYLKKIAQFKTDKPKRICKNHIHSFWGVDQFGNPYARCVQGNRLNEDCEELKTEEVKDNG